MNSELVKSLNTLIDETLQELEELKKSRFSAVEVKLDGPGSDGIAGKPANGSMGKEEDKDDEEDEDEDEAKKAESCAKEEDEESEEAMKSDDEDADDEEDGDEEDEKHEEKESKKKEEMERKMKKSQEETTSLMKSFVDERIKPIEAQIATIFELVNKIADQPVAARGVSSRAVPLIKSVGEHESLSKSQVVEKLWEMKKSGKPVDSVDVIKAETGLDLEKITNKYQLS